MNDELTPSERAALRARIVGGAHDIKPVGAHRGAWIAGSVAAVLVVAIAGGVAVTTTLSAPEIATTPTPSPTATAAPAPTPSAVPTPTATPTPSPSAAGPVVAFEGDCGRMLTLQGVSELLGGGEARYLPDQRLASNSEDALALIGGLSCTWLAGSEAVTVVAAAAAAIDPGLVASSAQIECDDLGCIKGREVGGLWVGVQMPVLSANGGTGLSSAEISAAASRIDAVIAAVEAAPHVTPVPAAKRSSPAFRGLADCAALQRRVEEATGEALTQEFPNGSDPLPNGVIERVLSSSVGVTSCAYHSADQESRSLVTVVLTPGVTIPPKAILDSPLTMETVVRGADRAWGQVPYDHVYDMDLVATVGENRLAVHRMTAEPAVTDAEQIAAAVIDFIAGRS